MNWAESGAVDAVMARSSRVTVPTGSVADAPTMDQMPAQVCTLQSRSVIPVTSGGKAPVWPL